MKYFMIVLVIVLFAFESLFYIQMLQQNSYNEKNRFLKFTLKNIKENINYFALKLLFGISLILFANFEFILYVYFFLIMFILIYLFIRDCTLGCNFRYCFSVFETLLLFAFGR